MKADRDDAPYHVRNQRSNRWRFLAILGIGSAATWAAMFMFAKPITIDVGQLQKAIQIGNQEDIQKQRIEAERARALAEFLEKQQSTPPHQPPPGMHAHRPAPPPAERQPRQTVFNDQNYRPRTDINTISMQSTGMTRSEQTPRNQQTRIRQGPERWEWESSTSREAGLLFWNEVNGQIEWSSVCDNERYGSFRYRDCRKAAKVTFARICGHYQPACMAENHYRPL